MRVPLARSPEQVSAHRVGQSFTTLSMIPGLRRVDGF
jgi:hypothetical protein